MVRAILYLWAGYFAIRLASNGQKEYPEYSTISLKIIGVINLLYGIKRTFLYSGWFPKMLIDEYKSVLLIVFAIILIIGIIWSFYSEILRSKTLGIPFLSFFDSKRKIEKKIDNFWILITWDLRIITLFLIIFAIYYPLSIRFNF